VRSTSGPWTEDEYVERVKRYRDEIGNLVWCAPQDWMCEDVALKKTGLTVEEHQRRTTQSVLSLRSRGLPVIPVLQGRTVLDYSKHWGDYHRAGIELENEAVVGVGSVCRRQRVAEITEMFTTFGKYLNLHAFGFKRTGLKKVWRSLTSSDSLAWSYEARRLKAKAEGCTGKHKNCANCILYAKQWTAEVMEVLT
jgi:hypothetical protein